MYQNYKKKILFLLGKTMNYTKLYKKSFSYIK